MASRAEMAATGAARSRPRNRGAMPQPASTSAGSEPVCAPRQTRVSCKAACHRVTKQCVLVQPLLTTMRSSPGDGRPQPALYAVHHCSLHPKS